MDDESVTSYKFHSSKTKSKKNSDFFYSCSDKDPGEITSPFEWAMSPFQLSFMGVTILY